MDEECEQERRRNRPSDAVQIVLLIVGILVFVVDHVEQTDHRRQRAKVEKLEDLMLCFAMVFNLCLL